MDTVLEVHIPGYVRKGFQMKEIEFSLEKGYLAALFGINGAGKTTLLSLLSGALSLPKGCEVKLSGYSIVTQGKEAKDRLGFVFDECPFEGGMSPQLVGEVFGRYYSGFEPEKYRKYLERFEIPKKKAIKKLSKGMTMKFQLAFALSHHAELILMDEPTASLDPVFREEFQEIVTEVLSEEECGMLISSQLVSELEPVADYTLLLHAGEQYYFGSTEQLLDKFRLVRGRKELFPYIKSKIIATRQKEYSEEALIYRKDEPFRLELECVRPKVEDLMYYLKNGAIRKEMLK